MPTYDYRCTSCKERFERTRPISESGQTAVCPTCGGESARAFSPVGVVFKGSGFHNTDYRAKPKSESAPAEKSEKPCPAAEGGSCSGCPSS